MTRWLVPAMFALLLSLGLAAACTGANDLLPWALMALILPVSAWYLGDGRRAAGAWVPTIVLITVIVAASIPAAIIATSAAAGEDVFSTGQNQLKKFSSYEELENFVNAIDGDNNYTYYGSSWAQSFSITPRLATDSAALAGGLAESLGKSDFNFSINDDYPFTIDDTTTDTSTAFSTTNIQVEGVDEADIVKTDGEYIYVVSDNKIFIIDAYPAEDARILSEIEENGYPTELFINGDKLAVLGWSFIRIYDVSDRENPVLVRDVSFSGYYLNSRMIGDYIYVVINSPALHYTYTWDNSGNYVRTKSEITLPEITVNDNTKTIQATEIYFFDAIYYSYRFTTIIAINIQDDDEEIATETILTSWAHSIFVSSNSIYITYTTYESYWVAKNTVIHKISIADGEIEYKCFGEVPGRVLNQFSMDEYEGYFRIATTTGEVWASGSDTAQNHVYVLDEDLNIVGRLEGIAPGERIYSARFLGSRAYLVTFKKVDPLFVIDLGNPLDPKVLGELEIPGYSDYLHPYDETHLIGVGKDTEDAGSFAWYQGVKIALFDVSDPENPQEISKYVIGERGTDSYALRDHRAFLFSKSKNLLVIPVSLVENSSSWWYSRPSWQGAYVFDVSLDDGFVLKGGITHYDNDDEVWSGYSYYSSSDDYSVKRSLYIDNVLYTVSSGMVKMNDLEDLREINEVELQ